MAERALEGGVQLAGFGDAQPERAAQLGVAAIRADERLLGLDARSAAHVPGPPGSTPDEPPYERQLFSTMRRAPRENVAYDHAH